jgi:hypothetical protein
MVIKHAIHTVDEKMGTIQYEMPNMTADVSRKSFAQSEEVALQC